MQPHKPSNFAELAVSGGPSGSPQARGRAVFYQSSDKAPAAGLLLALACGGGASVVLAFVYAYLLVYVPIIGVVTFLLSAGFGGGVGAATALGLNLGKVRNTRAAAFISVVVAAFALYVSWAAWVFALLNRAELDLALMDAFNPIVLLSAIFEINQSGAWSLKGLTPTGGLLWILWAVEALIIVGAATFIGAAAADNAFCEHCNEWCDELVMEVPRKRGQLHPDKAGELQLLAERLLQQRDLSCLESMGASDDPDDCYRVVLERCGCAATNTFTLRSVTASYDAKNERSEDTTDVCRQMLVSAQESDWLESLG